MNKNLWERYNKFEDEKLFSILTSDGGEFQNEAIEIAREILIKRGHEINLKALFLAKYENYSDEELIALSEANNKNRQKLAIETVDDLLIERGYQIEHKVESEEKLNYKPLIFGIFLVVINIYISGLIYKYNVTGIGPDALISYLSSVGIFHDIILRAIVIGLIIYYRQKQKGGYLILWVLAGVFFGGWALIGVGIMELMTSYNGKEKEEVVES